MAEFISANPESKEKKKKPFLAFYAVAWLVFFLALALIMRMPDRREAAENAAQTLNVRNQFSLLHTDPNSYLPVGSYMARVEENSLLFLDASGQVKQSFELPFTDVNCSSYGNKLFVKSEQQSDLLMFNDKGDLKTFETDSLIRNIESSDKKLLLIEDMPDGPGQVKLFSLDSAALQLTMNFNKSNLPLDLDFYPDRESYVISFLHLDGAKPQILLQNYNGEAEKVSQLFLPRGKIYSALHFIDDHCLAAFNENDIIFVDPAQQKIYGEVHFDKILDYALAEGKLGVLVAEEDSINLFLLHRDNNACTLKLASQIERKDTNIYMANNDSVIYIAQGNRVQAYNFSNGRLLAENELNETIVKLITLDKGSLIAFSSDNAYLLSLE